MHRFFRRTDIGILIGCIFIFVLFSLWNHDQWFNWYTFTSISRYTAILGLLAIGQTFVILIREIDLSVGSVYGVVGITFISLEHQLSVPLSAFLALLFALTIGLINADQRFARYRTRAGIYRGGGGWWNTFDRWARHNFGYGLGSVFLYRGAFGNDRIRCAALLVYLFRRDCALIGSDP
jgi:hypothetical protein